MQQPNDMPMGPGAMGPGPKPGDTPLDPKGIKAVQTAIQGAVDSVLSILEPGTMTHDEVLGKVAQAIMALKKPHTMGGLGIGPSANGIGDLESMAEDQGGAESETGAGEGA